MIKLILTVGLPGSGKSTWAQSKVFESPLDWVRINNDLLRVMTNSSVYSPDYEKHIIAETRKFLIKQALRSNKNIILDNLNLDKRHFEECCKIAANSNRDVQVFEKIFYADLDVLIERDSKRIGTACVGAEVIKKWWKTSGGKLFKFHKPKCEIFTRANANMYAPLVQDTSLPKATIWDNDGTISILNGRDPYDASTADQDLPHEHVIEALRLYFNAGYKIIFVSGREEKYREPTEQFYKKHFPEITYELYMRPTGNQEKDVLIKERIYNEYIKDKYNVRGWFDDRLQVCQWVYKNNLPLFRVNDPEATF